MSYRLPVFLLLTVLSAPSVAEVPIRQRAIDVIVLQDGTRLFGVSQTGARGKDVRLLMRGSWMKANAPDLLKSIRSQAEDAPQDKDSLVIEMLEDHLKTLRAGANPEIERIGFLEERLTAMKAQQKNETLADLIVLQIPSRLVRRRLQQKPNINQMALLGMINEVADIEGLSQQDLQAKLAQIPDEQMRKHLPKDSADASDSRKRLQRILLRADRVFGKTCKLILQSGTYIPENGASVVNVQALGAQLFGGQLQDQIQELLQEGLTSNVTAKINRGQVSRNPPATLPDQAATIAKTQGADIVEVTQMQLGLAGGAEVSISVYHRKSSADEWTLVSNALGSARTRDISAEQMQRINDDPRVKQVTALFSGLGSQSSHITKAVSLGACVEIAQKRARERLVTAEVGASGESGRLSVLRGSL